MGPNIFSGSFDLLLELVAAFCVGEVEIQPFNQSAPQLIQESSAIMAIMACLVVAVTLPFALFAGVGRGYLLSFGLAVLTIMMANLVAIVGWGEYFPGR